MASSDVDRLCTHRLSFAKRMYLHGVEHSSRRDLFSQAVAVHHFHAAVETTLKAILLQHEVRTEKEFNIGFDALLNAVDGHFKPKRLPWRGEMLKLNDLRNLVQHHAYQPAEAVEEQRLFARKFLEAAFADYLAAPRRTSGGRDHRG